MRKTRLFTIALVSFSSMVLQTHVNGFRRMPQNIGKSQGISTDGISYTAVAPKQIFILGEPIDISLIVKNERKKDLEFPSTNGYFDYQYEIWDPTGQRLPINAFGKKLLKYGMCRRVRVVVHPGEQITESLQVNLVYDF